MRHISVRVRARIQLFLTLLVAYGFQGCRDYDADLVSAEAESVAVQLALSVAKSTSPGATRMESGNVTGSPDQIELRCVIPFAVDGGEIDLDAEYASNPIIGNFNLAKKLYGGEEGSFFGAFYTSSCDFATGVNRLLAYGLDKRHSPGPNRGALVESFAEESSSNSSLQPKNIRFNLQPIQTKETYLGGTAEKTIAEELAEYLTRIANAKTDGDKTWKSDATDDNLKIMYKNFINELSDGVGDVLPGSAANVYQWVTMLKNYLSNLSLTGDNDAIRNCIIACVEGGDIYTKITPETGTWKGFPSTLNLPDGAAVVRWDGDKFVPEVQTTTFANINNIERFAYPAEVYYYGNSPTWVSDTDLSGNVSNKSKWAKADESDQDAVLSGFYEGPVSGSTATVAMRDPLQYGVAQLQVHMKSNSASLPHAAEGSIDVGTDKFQLTGIIVGGQLPVGFDFRPETVYPIYSEADMKFIYDTSFGPDNIYLSTSLSGDINTLVLQSYWQQSVKLVLEFMNNSQDFKGLNGTVYKGTKFYLVGEITPERVEPEANPKPYDNRVFTQDYTTIININVTTLAKAYNVLPNLLSPRLEMGIELTPKWEQATTTDVIL